MSALRPCNASMGLMLESTSERLRRRGCAHYYCPDKDPAVRIRMHEEAGELKIPFTSGILLGIGESDDERSTRCSPFAIWPIATATSRRPSSSPSTPSRTRRCAALPSLDDAEVAGWVALARLILGPGHERPGAAEPRARGARAAAALGAQRLGRRLARHRRFHQSRGSLARAARAARRTEAAGQASGRAAAGLSRSDARSPEFFEPAVRDGCLRRVDASGYALPPHIRAPDVEAA